jgi:putative flippase GtrA
MTISIKYAFFAILATGVNIGTQYMSLSIYEAQFSLYIAMLMGTLTGLILKYLLDKKYIFHFKTKTKIEDSFKFLLYTFMGVLTTIIFWGFELVFNSIFLFPSAKYIGAIIGLSIGYVMKYHLDKRFVFAKPKFAEHEKMHR